MPESEPWLIRVLASAMAWTARWPKWILILIFALVLPWLLCLMLVYLSESVLPQAPTSHQSAPDGWSFLRGALYGLAKGLALVPLIALIVLWQLARSARKKRATVAANGSFDPGATED